MVKPALTFILYSDNSQHEQNEVANQLGSCPLELNVTDCLTALAANQNTGSSLRAYNYAVLQRELRNEAAADAGFREALLMPDRQMAYHLTRMALADGDN